MGQALKLIYTVTGLSSEDVKALTDMGVDVIRKGMGHYIYAPSNMDKNTEYALSKYLEYSEEDGVEYEKINESNNSLNRTKHMRPKRRSNGLVRQPKTLLNTRHRKESANPDPDDDEFREMRETFTRNLRRLTRVEHNKNYINEDDRAGEIVMIKIENYPWYLRRIDSTHLFMVNSLEAARNKKGIPDHVAQHRGRPYYKDISGWLDGKITSEELNGKEYRHQWGT